MNRFFTSLFAISSVSLAAVLLFIAMSYIRKNSPKEQDVEVRRTPPTAPNVDSESSNKSEYPSSANFIGGVGIVEPVGEATVIGSQLPGVVEEVCVQPGDLVKTGDPLIRLDRRSAIADVAVAKAELVSQQARLAELQGNIATLQARYRAAVAIHEQAEANLQRAQTNLDLRTIVAPKDGTVLSVRIRVGEFVPASILSTPFISLGVIDPLHVRVDIDEAEIPRFSAGAKAKASLRGNPRGQVPLSYVRTEPLVVPKRSLAGTVSERVDTRVLQVIYSVDPKELKASVGQQVDVYIEGRNN